MHTLAAKKGTSVLRIATQRSNSEQLKFKSPVQQCAGLFSFKSVLGVQWLLVFAPKPELTTEDHSVLHEPEMLSRMVLAFTGR